MFRNFIHTLFYMTNDEKRTLVLKGNLFRGLLILSLPVMFNNLMKTLYTLADTYFVSKINETQDLEVTAVGMVFPVIMFIIAFGFGIQIAGTSLMSQHIGANNKDKANKVASQLMLFTFILGIFMMAIGILSSPLILQFMGIEGKMYDLSSIYLKIMFISIPFDFALMAFTSMRQAYGDTVTPVLFTVASVLINIALDPIFILVLDWGVTGAAIATIISKFIIVPFWIHKAFHDTNAIHLIINKMKLRLATIKKIVYVMIPASLGQAFNSVGFIVLNSVILSYSDQTGAAFNIGNRIMGIIMMPAMGIGSALAFYIGQNIGNNNYDRAKKAFHTSLKITLAIMITGALVMSIEPIREAIVKIFLKEDISIALAIEYMAFVALSIPLMGIYQNFNGVFQGAGKTTYTLSLAIVRLWLIRIPMIYLLKNFTNLGSTGIWYSMVISNVIVCLIGFAMYKSGRWERKLIE